MLAFALPANLDEIVFLTLEEVDLFHESVLEEGQLRGYKQQSDLLGALGRPKNAAYYAPNVDLVRVAAYYWHGISTSHGYTDGNKRTGYTSMANFLLMNGLEFVAPDFAMGQWVERMFEEDQFNLDVLDDMVRRHTTILTD